MQNSNFARASLLFLYFSLPFLRDYDVRMPKFAFYGEWNKQRQNFISPPELGYDALEFNFRKVRLHLTEEVRWNSCDKRLKERKFPF